MAVTEFAQAFEVTGSRGDYAAFALDGLDQHGNGPFRDCRLHSAEIIVGHVTKPFEQRRESLAHLLLTGRRDGGHGAAVKGAQRCEDIVTAIALIPTEFAGELSLRFVGLGPTVAKENFVSERIG